MPEIHSDKEEQEFLKLVVKLLFRRVKEGKVTFAPHLLEKLTPAMEAVKFDQEGLPLLETVQPIVASLAKTTVWVEEERRVQEEKEREKNSQMHRSLPSRV